MKKRRYSIIDSNRWLGTKRSSIIEKRLRELFSEFPPIHFSIQPHILQRRFLWRNNIHVGTRARTKSSLVPTTRCSRANQRFCHVIAATPSKNPNPSKKIPNPYLHDRCLRDSSRDEYCTIPDPFDPKKKLMQFTNLVEISRGEFYATTLQGALVVMHMHDERLIKITAVCRTQAVPSVPWRFFKEYMVEMNGKILLVFLIHEKSLAVVDHVEVFQLDLDKLRLVKVERLRGKTMFLKDKCVWVESAEFGCRDDCVFFTEGSENNWRMYETRTCCISSV